MILRKIVGRDIHEAMARVATEIGPDALILETRHEAGQTIIIAKRPDVGLPTMNRRTPAQRRERFVRSYKDGYRPLAEQMRDFGLSDFLIETLYKAVKGLGPWLLDKDCPYLGSIVKKVLAGLIPVKRAEDGKIVVLVGTTGVGKTTTLAKLAARDSLERGLSTAVITLDTFRVAAVEQLRTFTDMMGLPLRVVFTPRDMKQALAEFRHADKIFIDTTGRSPNDKSSIVAINGYLQDLDAELHLCVAAGSRRRDLELILKSYGCMKPQHIVMTKWDETTMPGETLSALIENNLVLSYITNGQRVPEDITCANAASLAELALEAA